MFGLYNITFLTTFHPNWIAIPVLNVYLLLVCVFALLIKFTGVQIR